MKLFSSIFTLNKVKRTPLQQISPSPNATLVGGLGFRMAKLGDPSSAWGEARLSASPLLAKS
ncbi:MAG: hypothetical protein EBR67_00485 [Proteobacteria bacterium]|nr:hypothetical protein [Pseudomonadota bacterium]